MVRPTTAGWDGGLPVPPLVVYCCVALVLGLVVCPPVEPDRRTTNEAGDNAPHVTNETDPSFNLEYGRYLSEVVKVLESDKAFAKKLENVSEQDIKSGDVASHLELVDHQVRTKLDELKRIEIDRLRKLTQKKSELEHGVFRDGRLWRSVPRKEQGIHRDNIVNDHLHYENKYSFEIEDLKKLIRAATRDLEKLDEARRDNFKQYELEKEFEFQQGLKNMTEEQKKVEQKKHDEERHPKHPQAHHPGSKAQLEQVWEEEDHMDKRDFDPKTFFAMHDLNGDGVLDEQEIEAILQLEAKKLYMSDPQHPGDPREMEEELNRMREHVFQRVDKDKDGLVSRQEFLEMAQSQEFEQDDGWKSLDEEPVYTQEELQQFIQAREKERQLQYQMQQQGYNYHPGAPSNMQHHPGYAQQQIQHGYQGQGSSGSISGPPPPAGIGNYHMGQPNYGPQPGYGPAGHVGNQLPGNMNFQASGSLQPPYQAPQQQLQQNSYGQVQQQQSNLQPKIIAGQAPLHQPIPNVNQQFNSNGQVQSQQLYQNTQQNNQPNYQVNSVNPQAGQGNQRHFNQANQAFNPNSQNVYQNGQNFNQGSSNVIQAAPNANSGNQNVNPGSPSFNRVDLPNQNMNQQAQQRANIPVTQAGSPPIKPAAQQANPAAINQQPAQQVQASAAKHAGPGAASR